ncbi:hypothetical protein G646_gp111 [Serratia phage phiMAM1]|uniref:Uncharacterized protein n=1 Tax=Serratia phage phiMAM1 TaxID=1262513 RepID=K7YGX3_9CAUD|nr:hypothetical protein G646_gp111 [Serratia phage phiMAM1]AFX93579.1 hypothetical protein MAM_111 [Serratia phage phiMAM1]
MKEILQPIVDQVINDWNKLYPMLSVSITVKQYQEEAGRVIIDGLINMKGVGVTDGTFEIGSSVVGWDNPSEFYNGLFACIEESMLAHSSMNSSHEDSSL